METFDVIVVGGGISGGLPAATYLQKAGLDVAVIEARPELGNFCPTHETWPETLDSPHASINFSGNSPAIEDLELESGTATGSAPALWCWGRRTPTVRTA